MEFEKKRIDSTLAEYAKMKLRKDAVSKLRKKIIQPICNKELRTYAIERFKEFFPDTKIAKESKKQTANSHSSNRFPIVEKKRSSGWLRVNTMTDEERHRLNGDKRVQAGYSSTGVKMPTHQEMEKMYALHKERRQTNKNKLRRESAKIFVSVPMGGQNKHY